MGYRITEERVKTLEPGEEYEVTEALWDGVSIHHGHEVYEQCLPSLHRLSDTRTLSIGTERR